MSPTNRNKPGLFGKLASWNRPLVWLVDWLDRVLYRGCVGALALLVCWSFVCLTIQFLIVLLYLIVGLNMSFSCGFRNLFGEVVDGTAYVVFGVMHEGQKKNFPGSIQRVLVSTYIHFWFFSVCQSASWLVCPYFMCLTFTFHTLVLLQTQTKT